MNPASPFVCQIESLNMSKVANDRLDIAVLNSFEWGDSMKASDISKRFSC